MGYGGFCPSGLFPIMIFVPQELDLVVVVFSLFLLLCVGANRRFSSPSPWRTAGVDGF